jgi:single-strand DNA-binding protein
MTTSGTKVLHNSVAVSEVYKGEKKTDFFDITAFGEKADIIEKFFKKGHPILLEGKLKQEKWEKDGKKNSKVLIWVDNIVFTENKRSNSPQKQDDTPVVSQPAVATDVNAKTKAEGDSLVKAEQIEDTPF